MTRAPHTLVKSFNKLAEDLVAQKTMMSSARKTPNKPASVGDTYSRSRRETPQTYSAPTPKTDITDPNTSIQQKAAPPPPVQ